MGIYCVKRVLLAELPKLARATTPKERTDGWTQRHDRHNAMTVARLWPVKLKMIIYVFDRLENIVEKGEIACTSNFSFSCNVFKMLLPRPVKWCHCVGMG